MMTGRAALTEGGRQVLRLRKLVILFYVLNLLAALAAVAPVVALIHGRLAHSAEDVRLFSNFDPAWAVETLAHFAWWPLAGAGISAAIAGMVFLFLTTFLAGGTLAVFHREERPFFSSCALYFWPMFRIMLAALVCYAVVLGLNGGAATVINKLKENSMQAGPFVVAGWIRMAVIFFLALTVNMIADYARIIVVVDGKRSAIRSLIGAFRFAAAHPGRTIAVYWTATAIGAALLVVYHLLSEAAGQSSMSMVVLVLVLRQVYMLARMWVRLWTWSSEIHVYAFNSTIVAPEPPSLAVAG